MKPLVSIIIAAYNAEKYIGEAIQSVLDQDYSHWELLVINDGSTDNTQQEVKRFKDSRISTFKQTNQGVGAARNVGLINMNGEYFCFLDADDVWTSHSLSARLKVFFKNPQVCFVDGGVDYVDEDLVRLNKQYRPSFIGNPYDYLLQLDSRCLFGPTWMIKRETDRIYQFEVDMSHAEDVYFYLTISKGKFFNHTSKTIMLYRQSETSAMKNIRGLESGYILLIKKIRKNLKVSFWTIVKLKIIVSKIMILSYLFDAKKIIPAIKTPFNILKA